MYDEKIVERFKEPKFAGKLQKADAVGEEGNVKCGDIMKIYINVEKSEGDDRMKDKISDIRFETYGCVTAIASSDYLCELALGKTLEDASKITSQDVVKQMGDVPAIKVHCSVLAQDALKKAIENYVKLNK